MESAKEIMARLGFKQDADDSTKAAFIKNLIKQAYGVDVKIPQQEAVQLSFEISEDRAI